MSTTVQTLPPAWEPLTPRGVAAFAQASVGRLWLVQLIVASLAAGAVIWFLHTAWFPVVRSAIQKLPPTGEIRGERLNWPGDAPMQLAGNRFLGLAVDLNHTGQLGHEAHLQLEFGRSDLRVICLFRYAVLEYPPAWRVAFNRTELDPWWGAWEPWILAGAALGAFVGLLASWTLLATLYWLPVWLITFFENRDLKLGQSWRVAGAAQMPGALFFTAAIVAYGLNLTDLVGLGVVAVLHVITGWVYLVIAPLFLPKHPEAQKEGARANPFAPAAQPKPKIKL